MRSLHYCIGGAPRNVDDCLDFANADKLLKAFYRPRTDITITENCSYKELICDYTFYYEHNAFTVTEVLSRCFLHEPDVKNKENVQNANRRLKRTLNKILQKIEFVSAIDKEEFCESLDIHKNSPLSYLK